MAPDYIYTMLPEYNLCWAEFSGEVSLRDLTVAHEDFRHHPQYVSSIDELLDLSQCSVGNLTPARIELIRQYLIQQPRRDNSKSAMVVGSQLDFGIARMMGSLISDVAPVTRGVFYTAGEALEWLRPGQVEMILQDYANLRDIN